MCLKPCRKKKISNIADEIYHRGKNGQRVKLVLISGPSSSGKTTFSKRLSIQLMANGLKPYPISLDNYFVDREKTPKDEKGDYDYTKANYKDPVCIIMGAEDTGVPYEHLSLCDEWIKIPLMGKIESLNVSVAAGILIYEAVKQRGFTEDKTASAL